MTVTVDGKKVEVPMGSTILEAANAAGSRVPTLCHDNKLHPFGACRICLVEVEGTPRKFTPSCTTPATDNMVVKTTTPGAHRGAADGARTPADQASPRLPGLRQGGRMPAPGPGPRVRARPEPVRR